MPPTTPAFPAELDLRQLRHHTKNTLARLIAQVSAVLPPQGIRAAAEVERCVLLSAQISDALFGLTRSPGPFAERLAALCDGVVGMMADRDQCLRLQCRVDGLPPPGLHEALLRIAHEFVGNAVKHGMHMRLVGRIDVSVSADGSGVRLRVVDDGWGCLDLVEGEGLGVARALAADAGGRIVLRRAGDRTEAEFSRPFAA